MHSVLVDKRCMPGCRPLLRLLLRSALHTQRLLLLLHLHASLAGDDANVAHVEEEPVLNHADELRDRLRRQKAPHFSRASGYLSSLRPAARCASRWEWGGAPREMTFRHAGGWEGEDAPCRRRWRPSWASRSRGR